MTRTHPTLLLLLLLAAVAGCGSTTHAVAAGEARVTPTAATALETLPVKGRAPKTGYDREQFGDGWASVHGCDTRDRMLARDLTRRSYVDGCRVESGELNDPYTAARIRFERGG